MADYLGDFGVRRLDLLVVTHFHNDHANGVARLLERMEVGCWPSPMWTKRAPSGRNFCPRRSAQALRCGSSAVTPPWNWTWSGRSACLPRWARGRPTRRG
ncbi:MAG: MBL fold metallo-hydrolase [Oscillospiraceae bacterium]